ncbi:MAG: histidine-type phosphatase [Proteobacteria bacterium]|nr:histidine-type phosphatase [Pseudomonadota bacterium]
MQIRVFAAAVLTLLAALPLSLPLASPAEAQVAPVPRGWQLERAVVLSRHGVRPPTKPNSEIDREAATPWPEWPVPAGDLTPRGYDLMTIMGRYYRVLYGGSGLVEANICPPPNIVVAWTDVLQRTRQSGAALLAGLYPRCPNPILTHQADLSKPDPLFHPQPTASCPMDAASDTAEILERLGGSFAAVTGEYEGELSLMQQTLCPPSAADGRHCGLGRRLTVVEPSREPGRLHLKGPIGTAAFAAESFLMEAAEGKPWSEVAWGRLSGEGQLRSLLKVNRLQMDLLQKTLPIARQHGSNMLAQIVGALQDGHDFPGLQRRAEPVRLGFLVGHDTNIANVARLLNLGWQVAGFEANDPSPGGALSFELLRDTQSGRRYVRVIYLAQTLDQLRNATPLDQAVRPGMVEVAIPACAGDLTLNACPLEKFVAVARAAIDPACVTIAPPQLR